MCCIGKSLRVGFRWFQGEILIKINETNIIPKKTTLVSVFRDLPRFSDEQTSVEVQLYGVCLDSRPLRIVTEYCGGGAAFELLHGSPQIDVATWDAFVTF